MSYDGGCTCGKVRYRVHAPPIVTHCCHCRQCQRHTGSAFMLSAVVEKDQLEVLSGEPASAHFAGTSHTAWFCKDCGAYVWSAFSGRFAGCRFVRVGTLDDPDACPPDVHIFTGTKQPWVVLPEGAPSYTVTYELPEILSADSLERLKAAG